MFERSTSEFLNLCCGKKALHYVISCNKAICWLSMTLPTVLKKGIKFFWRIFCRKYSARITICDHFNFKTVIHEFPPQTEWPEDSWIFSCSLISLIKSAFGYLGVFMTLFLKVSDQKFIATSPTRPKPLKYSRNKNRSIFCSALKVRLLSSWKCQLI